MSAEIVDREDFCTNGGHFFDFYVVASFQWGIRHSRQPRISPGSTALAHTLFDALPLPLSMPGSRHEQRTKQSRQACVPSRVVILQSRAGLELVEISRGECERIREIIL